ncbi:craniofacial development protein 2-like [Macrobrachium nipponense]|uniref:craniofacial development protein 2-like n=1 Tax=Macrobrachium nipponense TaxID=159736 RepID=UPI0030C7C4D5
MTRRGRAIADLMKTRRVDILCEGRNGVGIILSSEMKNEIFEVNRRNDRNIWVRLMVENCTVNIFSAYAPQIGCSDEEKDRFWSDLEEEIEKVPADEKCLVSGDLNGHLGQNNHVISHTHGSYGYD